MTDPRLAAATLQVLRAGNASEEAIAHLEGGNAKDGMKALQRALASLERARDRLSPPAHEAQVTVLESMIATYENLIASLDRGQPPESVAESVLSQEGNLWASGPLL